MGIMSAYIGLIIAFIIIISFFLYFFIASNMPVAVKILIIPIIVWYSLVLFYTPDKLMGWPTWQPIPNGSRIISMIIKEPFKDDLGSIYIWAIDYNISEKWSINPKRVFRYNEKNTPRVYKIPYSKELHKKLIEARSSAKKNHGFMMWGIKKGKGKLKRGGNLNLSDDVEIRIIDPMKLLQKDKK